MNDTESLEGLQQEKTGLEEDSKRLKAKRRSLEEKAKTLEENARTEKLEIDKKLATQILEEENRTHNDAVKELEDKIANLEKQLRPSPSAESTPTQTVSESTQEISDDVDESVSVGVLPQPEQSEVEVSQRIRKGRNAASSEYAVPESARRSKFSNFGIRLDKFERIGRLEYNVRLFLWKMGNHQ